MTKSPQSSYAPILRSCYRCGQEFQPNENQRVCMDCRKPPESRGVFNRELSVREKQIIRLVQQAKLNKEIAYELCLAEGTIKEYLNRIYRKLEVANRTQLAIWALQQDSQ